MPVRLSSLTAASLLVMMAGCGERDGEVHALGTLERDRIELAADTNEPIVRIAVSEGQRLGIGDVLIVQESARAEAALDRARSEEQAAGAALAEAEEGPRAQRIVQGRARLQAARSARQTARFELDRQVSLVERNYSSQNLVDILKGRFEESVAREAEAEAALDELLEGTRDERIDQARNRYAAARALVEELAVTVERAIVKSPVDGVVEALPFEIGERPPPGATVAVVLAEAPTYARVHVPQGVRTRIRSGSRARIAIDGHERAYPGTVRWIAADAAFTPYFALTQHDRSRLSYVAEIDLVGENVHELPVGVPVEVVFPELGQ
ncbi:MAG: HlyD family efflux transporter periplasmic adaptor subunit [Gammaproteobacteria bacterium]|nr:HlyD family efflux transporter periplasmic adaptor subunit [Gammaproteobacteria bacterium]MDE0364815.1 HlyD family efflux transporter periplasmic adaptor subunit [Gammaproteobacteria bacterium]